MPRKKKDVAPQGGILNFFTKTSTKQDPVDSEVVVVDVESLDEEACSLPENVTAVAIDVERNNSLPLPTKVKYHSIFEKPNTVSRSNSCESPQTVNAPVNTPDSRNQKDIISQTTSDEPDDNDVIVCIVDGTPLGKIEIEDEINIVESRWIELKETSEDSSDENHNNYKLDTEIEVECDLTANVKAQAAPSIISSTGRPMRQAKLDTIAKIQVQKEITASVDKAIRNRGRSKLESDGSSSIMTTNPSSRKRSIDCQQNKEDEDVDDVDVDDVDNVMDENVDEDFVEVKSSRKSSISNTKSGVATFFLSKEEKARRKAEEEEKLRQQKEKEEEATRVALALEREAKIRQQFREERLRNQSGLQDAFGSGIHLFFQQTFVGKGANNVDCDTDASSCQLGEADEFLNSLFPAYQCVGLGNIASLPESNTAVFSKYSVATTSCSGLQINSASSQNVSLLGCVRSQSICNDDFPDSDLMLWRSLWVEWFSSQFRKHLLALQQHSKSSSYQDSSSSSQLTTSTSQCIDLCDTECVDLTNNEGNIPSKTTKFIRCESSSTVSSACGTMISRRESTEVIPGYNSLMNSDFHGNKRNIKIIMRWMEIWAGKRRRKQAKATSNSANRRSNRNREKYEDSDDCPEEWKQYQRAARGSSSRGYTVNDDYDKDSGNETPNVLVILGPSGCGKTEAVYSCAKATGYNVIEVGSNQDRKGADVKKLVLEASQSHGLGLNVSGTMGDTKKSKDNAATQLNLILFDEADIIDAADSAFHNTICQLARISKCPIVITTETHLPFAQSLNSLFITFDKPQWYDIQPIIFKAFENLVVASYQRLSLTTSDTPVFRSWLHNCSQVMAFLFDGDLRSCLQTMTVLSTGSWARIIAAEQMPSSSFNVTRVEKGNSPLISFNEWLAVRQFNDVSIPTALKHILFRADSEMESPILRPIEDAFNYAHLQIVAPVVYEVSPNMVTIENGIIITIRGKNFLQAASRCDNAPSNKILGSSFMQVHVFVGCIECPCQLLGDDQISVFIPPKTFKQGGTYPISVELSQQVLALRQIQVSSAMTSCGSSWLQLHSAYDQAVITSSSSNNKPRSSAHYFNPTTRNSSEGKSWSRKAVAHCAFHSDEEEVELAVGGEGTIVVDDIVDDSSDDDDDAFEHLPNRQNMICVKRSAPKRLQLISNKKSRRLGGVKARIDSDSDSDNNASDMDQDILNADQPTIAAGTTTRAPDHAIQDTGNMVLEENANSIKDAFDANNTEATSTSALALDSRYPELWLCFCRPINILLSQPISLEFSQPVNPKTAPAYSSIISRPMDLGTISTSIAEGLYSIGTMGNNSLDLDVDVQGLVADVRLVWSNCLHFNGATSSLTKNADVLATLFENEIFRGIQDLLVDSSVSYSHRVSIVENNVLFDNSCIFQSALVSEPPKVLTAADLPSCLEQDLVKELSQIECIRQETKQASMSINKNWRMVYSDCGLEYQDDTAASVWLYPTAIGNDKRDSEQGSLQALVDYHALLNGYCDAEIFSSTAREIQSGKHDACRRYHDEIDESEPFYDDDRTCHALSSIATHTRDLEVSCFEKKFSVRQKEWISGYSSRSVYRQSYLYGMRILSCEDNTNLEKETAISEIKKESAQASVKIAPKIIIIKKKETIDELDEVWQSDEEAVHCGNKRQGKEIGRAGIISKRPRKHLDTCASESEESDSDSEEANSSDDETEENIENNKECSMHLDASPIATQIPRDLLLMYYQKQYFQFVSQVMCSEFGPCLKSCVSYANYRSIALDYLPLFGRIVQTEANIDAEHSFGGEFNRSNSGTSGGRRSSRRISSQRTQKYSYSRNNTALSEAQLNELLIYGFVGTQKGDGSEMGRGRTVLCLEPAPWSIAHHN